MCAQPYAQIRKEATQQVVGGAQPPSEEACEPYIAEYLPIRYGDMKLFKYAVTTITSTPPPTAPPPTSDVTLFNTKSFIISDIEAKNNVMYIYVEEIEQYGD
ncbi:MAG: hypothetical protein J7J22_04660 [Candidatus Verstraetearchaeota archaeon]|nr:hypothetical protein [Candidatus Verstraetearchaeota archaeon]